MRAALLLACAWLAACQHAPPAPDPGGAPDDATGLMDRESLLAGYPVFAQGYAAATPAAPDVAKVAGLRGPLHLVIVFGTWCHDSKREVPRLLRLLEQAYRPGLTWELVAVGRDKAIPAGLNLPFEIRRTPTVIVLRGGRELGRVVEVPDRSWAADLAAIAAGG